jgi:hypothetical protein
VAKKRKGRPNNPRRDIDGAHHVARYCNPQLVDRDPESDSVRGVFPQAFALRVKDDEEYLSLRHFEHFGSAVADQWKGVVKAFREKIKNVRPKSAVARLNSGAVLAVGVSRGHELRMRDKSSDKNPGYAGLEGMPRDNSDTELLVLLATQLCLEVKEIAEIDKL